MAELVIGPATEVVKCFIEPIKRQFNYLCCFNTNIQNLRDKAKRLGDAKDEVDGQVVVDQRNAQVIVRRVENWQADASKFEEDMKGVEIEIQNVENRCLAIIPRFLLSRKATKMAAAMKELQVDHGTLGQISHPPPPAAMVSIPPPPAAVASIPPAKVYELKSRKDFENDIIATLKEKKVSLMGIYGMGGVGKTTMAEKIKSRAKEEGLFDEIVMVVVSQPVNAGEKLRIQKEISELLGLKLGDESLQARAHLLCTRLMSTNRTLIILDDLWKEISLEDLGIPKKCTILLTSRDSGVFRAMDVERTFQVETLDEVEAWSLFKETVGACADDQSLFPIAQEIVRECNGLPIAIVNVGAALKDEMDKSIWEDAVQDLRSVNPQDIPDFLAKVYNPLKLSYDLLPSKPAKSIFLLCCLFPEDRNIRIFDLYIYAWGLGIFVGKRRLQDAKNKMQTLVKMLKSRSLLLDGDDKVFVKMHDVVRDVGIFIAAKEGLIDPNLNWDSWAREESKYVDCSWISLFGEDIITLPRGLTFPNLRFLLIERPMYDEPESSPLFDNLFKSDRKLCVLSIEGYAGLRSLPDTIQLQKNMRTLILCGCQSLEDISVVGELVSLEILHCQHCHRVEELPVEIGRLNQLKLLDISHCRNLRRIPAGVISKLIRLEELTLTYSFKKWELAVEEGGNAALCELNFLSSLTTLKIEIQDATLAAEQIHLPNLVEFEINLGPSFPSYGDYGRKMVLFLERDVIMGEWIHQLIRSTESLVLLGGCSRLSDGTTTVFPLLKELELRDIDDLEEIHKGPISSDSFSNLSSIKIWSCHSLRSMLEHVVLCDEEERDKSSCITFPKLEELFLVDLPTLTTLCKGIDNIEFPALTQMYIRNCSNMKSLVSSTKNDHKKCPDDDSLHLFCKPASFGTLKELRIERSHSISRLWCDQIPIEFFTKLVDLNVSNCDNIKSLFLPSIAGNLVNLKKLIIKSCEMVKVIDDKDNSEVEITKAGFGKLEVLKVKECDNMKSLFSPSIARNLVNLKKLVIESCGEMVKVIEDKEDKKIERSPFISLEKLKLKNVPKLKIFFDGECALLLQSLRQVLISKCPLMERFVCGSFSSDSFQYLQSIRIESCLMLEQVILWNEEKVGKDINRSITFPKLDTLHLSDLPMLTYLCKGIQSIDFPILTRMKIGNCPNMKNLVETTCPGAINRDADDSLHLFCKSEATFGMLGDLTIDGYDSINSKRSLSLWCDQIPLIFFSGLETLIVSNCGNINSLFSPSVAGNLVNLRELIIKSCPEMVKVIEGDEDKSSLLIKLEELELIKLPKLKIFCDWRGAIQLPSLTSVEISECPEMERFTFGSFTTPNLKNIRINEEYSTIKEEEEQGEKDYQSVCYKGRSRLRIRLR